MFLLPPKVHHSPQRFENTIGLVIERTRRDGELDGFIWYCDNCTNKLHEAYFELKDIEKIYRRFLKHTIKMKKPVPVRIVAPSWQLRIRSNL